MIAGDRWWDNDSAVVGRQALGRGRGRGGGVCVINVLIWFWGSEL